MSDAPGDRGEGSGVNPPEAKSDIEKRVDEMIGDLTGRRVRDKDRVRLGKALDTANAPEGGRSGMDKALGRAIRYTAAAVLMMAVGGCAKPSAAPFPNNQPVDNDHG